MRGLTVMALRAAVGLSVALMLAGCLVPFYSTESSTSSGESTSSSQTLVEANGLSALIVLAIPLAISLLVVAALRLRRRTSALLLAGSLACFSVLALMTIGLFVLPVVAALAIACRTAPAATPVLSEKR